MSNPNALVVDVAKLAETPEYLVEQARLAIMKLSWHMGGIALGKVTEDYSFSDSKPLAERTSNDIYWQRTTADLHIITTDQELPHDGSLRGPIGLAWTRTKENSIVGERHALVTGKHASATWLQTATVHETIHLILGPDEAGRGHCSSTSCVMYHCMTPEIHDHYLHTNDPACICDPCMSRATHAAESLIIARNKEQEMAIEPAPQQARRADLSFA